MANPPARSKCGTAPSPEDRQGRSWCSRVCRSIAVRTLVAARLMLGERAGRRGCGGAGGMGSRRRAVRRSLRVAVVARGAYGRPAQDRMQLEARREQGTRAGGERASLRRLGRGRPSSRFLLQPRSSTTPCQSFAPPLGPARHHRQSRHPRPPDRSPQEEDEARVARCEGGVCSGEGRRKRLVACAGLDGRIGRIGGRRSEAGARAGTQMSTSSVLTVQAS